MIKEAGSKVQELQDTVLRLKDEQQSEKDNHGNTLIELKKLQDELALRNQTVASLNKKLMDSHQRLETMASEKVTLESSYKDIDELNSHLQDEVTSMAKEIRKRRAVDATANNNLAAKKAELTEMMQLKKDEEKKVSQLTERFTNNEKQLSNLRSENADLMIQKNDLAQKAEQLEQDLEDKRNAATAAQTRIEEVESACAALVASNSRLRDVFNDTYGLFDESHQVRKSFSCSENVYLTRCFNRHYKRSERNYGKTAPLESQYRVRPYDTAANLNEDETNRLDVMLTSKRDGKLICKADVQ